MRQFFVTTADLGVLVWADSPAEAFDEALQIAMDTGTTTLGTVMKAEEFDEDGRRTETWYTATENVCRRAGVWQEVGA